MVKLDFQGVQINSMDLIPPKKTDPQNNPPHPHFFPRRKKNPLNEFPNVRRTFESNVVVRVFFFVFGGERPCWGDIVRHRCDLSHLESSAPGGFKSIPPPEAEGLGARKKTQMRFS